MTVMKPSELADELERLSKYARPRPWRANLAPSMKYCSSVEYHSDIPGLSETVCQVRQSEVLVGAAGLTAQNATTELIATLANNLPVILTALRTPSTPTIEAPVTDGLVERPDVVKVVEAIENLVSALKPLAAVPLVYPRNGSGPQEAQLEPGDQGPYIAADVVRARQLIQTLTGRECSYATLRSSGT